jgi:long-chain acyl-CoA synthetase
MVPFWSRLSANANALAVLDANASVEYTYAALEAIVDPLREQLEAFDRGLVLLVAGRDIGAIALYLAALQAGHAVFLSPAPMQREASARLIETYQPEIVLFSDHSLSETLRAFYGRVARLEGYELMARARREHRPLHPDLALVLSTSASTGSAKLARFSWNNLAASATQVAHALEIVPEGRLLASLPFSFVYGLSVLNSALESGASIVLASGTPADRTYWDKVTHARVTTLPAVTQIVDYLRTLRIGSDSLPTVSKITHSGDALDATAFEWLYQHYGIHGVRLYLMYGQTEACGRMTILHPRHLPRLHRSVGSPVGASNVSISAGGEVVFRGPAVMMGYAHSRDDLALGDESHGILRTGDGGHLDENGFLFLTGRLSRSCKIFGQRMSLDEIERDLRADGAVAAIEQDGHLVLVTEGTPNGLSVGAIARMYRIPPQHIRIVTVDRLPRTAHGKIDYARLHDITSVRTQPLR